METGDILERLIAFPSVFNGRGLRRDHRLCDLSP